MTHINTAMLHKLASIEHAIKRIRNVYTNASDLTIDLTSQDSIVFNLQRACETCIDVANIANKQHQTLNLEIVKHVVENKLSEFTRFVEEVKKQN